MGALLRVLSLVAAALPWSALGRLGAVLGWLAGSLLGIRRAHVRASMRAAGVVSPEAEARAMYRSLGTSAFELLRVSRRADDVSEKVVFDAASEARWRDAFARGRGAVLAASHTGNWDLAACRVALDTELLVVTKRLSLHALDAFWQSTRASRGVRLTGSSGAIGRARAVLGRNGAVAMMIDQVPGSARHAMDVAFLGQKAHADRAPAALAAACRAPLIVTASRRMPDGRHVLFVLDVIVPPSRPARRWIREATASATDRLADFVRAHPDQWLWLHRRWRLLDRLAGGTTLAARCPKETTRSSSPAEASRVA